MAKRMIKTNKAAPPTSLYVNAWEVTGGRIIFLSGTTSRDAEGNLIGRGDIVAQTRQALENIKAVLAEVGGTLEDVVKVQFLVRDMAHWEAINVVRKEYWPGESLPASTFMEVNRFVSPDWMIEIDCIAALD